MCASTGARLSGASLLAWLLVWLLCAHAHVVHALSWDRLPYSPPARAGGILAALPLSWAFPNDSSSVARAFYASLPDDAPPRNASWLLASFGGETTAGSTNEMMFTLYPPSLLPASRAAFVRTVGTGVEPHPRQQLVGTVIHNRMQSALRPPHLHYTAGWLLLFGGYDMSRVMNSLWIYDLNMNQYIGLGPYPAVAMPPDSPAALAAMESMPRATSLIDLGLPMLGSAAGLPEVSHDAQGCPWPQVRHGGAMVTLELVDETAPQSRGGASGVGRQVVLLHGGQVLGNTQRLFGDLWMLEVDSHAFHAVVNTQAQSIEGGFVLGTNASAPACVPWTLLHSGDSSLPVPSPRYGQALVASSLDGGLFLYGGASAEIFGQFFADLWFFAINSRAWTRIEAQVSGVGGWGTGSLSMRSMAPASGDQQADPEDVDTPDDLRDSFGRNSSPSTSSTACSFNRTSRFAIPTPRAYGPLLMVGSEWLILWMGSADLILPPEESFVFNLTRYREQGANGGRGVAGAPVGVHIPNVTCTDCWVALNNSLLPDPEDTLTPPPSEQPIRMPAVSLPLRMDGGKSYETVLYGGVPSSNAHSAVWYVLAVDTEGAAAGGGGEQEEQCPSDFLQRHVLLRTLPVPPVPYYANEVQACSNLTRTAGSGALSRPDAPLARYYHAGVGLEDDILIFGGATGVGQTIQPLDDLWIYSMIRDTWVQLGEGDGTGSKRGAPGEAWPDARTMPLLLRHQVLEADVDSASASTFASDAPPSALSSLPGDSLLLFAGSENSAAEFFNDTWLYSLSTRRWKEQPVSLNASNPQGSGPTGYMRGRYGHGGEITGGALYVFGGAVGFQNAYSTTNELWRLDLSSWVWSLDFAEQLAPAPAGTAGWPAPRFSAACAMVPPSISAGWRRSATGAGTDAPPGDDDEREDLSVPSNQMIMGLGGNFQTIYQDWWLWNLREKTWEPLRTKGQGPTNRFFPMAAVLHNRMYIFGGYDGGPRNDLFELDLPTLVWRPLASTSLVSGTPPIARSGSTGITLARRAQMVLFSGEASPWTNDMHVLSMDVAKLEQEAEEEEGDEGVKVEGNPSGHDVLALFVPYLPTPASPDVPQLSFATLAASINHYQIIGAGFVQYFISGTPASDNGGDSSSSSDSAPTRRYSPFTRRLSTVTLTSPSLLRGVLRGRSGPAPAGSFPLLNCAGSSCFVVSTSDPGGTGPAVEFESMHLARAHSWSGSAFRITASAVVFRSVHFDSHQAMFGGAAVAANQSAITMSNCVFERCTSGQLGGAIYAAHSNVTLVDCMFESNNVGDVEPQPEADVAIAPDVLDLPAPSSTLSTASPRRFGGAVFTLASSLSVHRCVFTNNSALPFGFGGAVGATAISAAVARASDLLQATAWIRVERTRFEGNRAQEGGAVFQSDFEEPLTEGGDAAASAWLSSYANNSWVGNIATLSGGALFLDKCNGVRIRGDLFDANEASPTSGGGGGVFWKLDTDEFTGLPRESLDAAAPVLTNVSFRSNRAAYGPHLASPPVDLWLDDGRASLTPQTSSELIRPSPVLSLRDYWSQVPTTDAPVNSFVSALPSRQLTGETVVPVVAGRANFTDLRLVQTPSLRAVLSFVASLSLPLYDPNTTGLAVTARSCVAGEFLPGGMGNPSGTPVCLACPSGSFNANSSDAMAGACFPCPPGSYQNSSNSTSCIPCAIGTFSPASGLASDSGCPVCPSGSFAFNAGSSHCAPCGQGMTCENRQARATRGRWMVSQVEHLESFSPFPSSVTSALPYLSNGSTDTGEGDFIVSAYTIVCPHDNCNSDGECGLHRLNPPSSNVLCGACESADYSELNGRCALCTEPNVGLIVALFALGFFFVFVLHRLSASPTSNTDLHILTYFVQSVLFQVGSGPAAWIGWLSFFNLSPKALIGGGGGTGGQGVCLWPMSAYGELAIDIFTPGVLGLMLLSLMLLHYTCDRMTPHWLRSSCLGRVLPRWVENEVAPAMDGTEVVFPREGFGNGVALSELSVSFSHPTSTTHALAAGRAVVPTSHGAESTDAAPSPDNLDESVPHDFLGDGRGSLVAARARDPSLPAAGVRKPVPLSSRDSYVRTSLSLLLFVYQPLSSAILNALNCVHVGNGARAVFLSPTMDCSSSEYRGWMVVLIIGVILITVGAPLMLAAFLYRNRHLIRPSAEEMEKQAMMPAGGDASAGIAAVDAAAGLISPTPRSLVDPYAALFSRRWGVLFQAYSLRRQHGYLYHIFILARRLLFVVLDVALFLHPGTKLVTFTLWNMCIFHVHLALQPYHMAVHNRMEMLSLLVLTLVSLLLIPHAATDNIAEGMLPMSLQVILSLLILPLTGVLIARLLVKYWRRFCGPRCNKRAKQDEQQDGDDSPASPKERSPRGQFAPTSDGDDLVVASPSGADRKRLGSDLTTAHRRGDPRGSYTPPLSSVDRMTAAASPLSASASPPRGEVSGSPRFSPAVPGTLDGSDDSAYAASQSPLPQSVGSSYGHVMHMSPRQQQQSFMSSQQEDSDL